MLISIRIQNIVLIQSCSIAFEKGLNVLTGETGAGKSVLLSSLALLLGDRSDIGLIRHGETSGSIEASFDIHSNQELLSTLESLGIEHNPQEDLILKRDLYISGKSRAFVNQQNTAVSTLKKLAPYLVQSCGQLSGSQLLSAEKQRHFIDLWGDALPQKSAFQKTFYKQKQLQAEINLIIENEKERWRTIEACQREIEEIDNADLKDSEEETLFQEYSLLTHQEELIEKLTSITQTLSHEEQGLMSAFAKQRNLIKKITEIDPRTQSCALSFESAFLEMEEVANSLKRHLEDLEFQPDRLQVINSRLSLISSLKRKYGSTITDILAWKSQREKELYQLEHQDEKLHELQNSLEKLSNECNRLAYDLTQLRVMSASRLERLLTQEIHELNMSSAQIQIQVASQERSLDGDEAIEIMVAPNKGEKFIKVREAASGGELSRLMLALQVILASKHQIPTLLFDEIDANIGGTTASIVGHKLHQLSATCQVLCITHFPQVAEQADAHFQIFKTENQERTISSITKLNTIEKNHEIQRMLGKAQLSLPSTTRGSIPCSTHLK